MKELQNKELQPMQLPQLPENPLISVLVPNYNYARYIGQTLESALRQTYPYFEVIVCDDGSTDNSCAVIETHIQKDSRLKLVRKRNGGVASALNAAYQQSNGQIICILDADDIWMPNKLEKILEAFKLESKCGFVIHNVIQIDGSGKIIKPTPMYRRLACGWMAPFALENGGFVHNIPPASALSVRREVADFIFPIDETFVRNADSLIFRLAPFVTVIGSVQDVLSEFRLHGANATSFSALTVDVLEREQAVLSRMHKEQERFLSSVYDVGVAQKLTSLDSSVAVVHDLYLLARFKGAPRQETRQLHRQLVTHPQFSTQFGGSLPQQWLLRWGEYLPDAAFAALFHQVYGTSKLKRWVKLLASRVLTPRQQFVAAAKRKPA